MPYSDSLHRGTQVEDELDPLWPVRESAIFHPKVELTYLI